MFSDKYNGDDGYPFDEEFHQKMVKEFCQKEHFTPEQKERIESAFEAAILEMNRNIGRG